MNVLSESLTARIKEQVKDQLPQILPQEVSNFAPPVIEKLIKESRDEVTLAKASSQPQSTYEAASTLTEFELKKILLDKMEKSESYLTAPEHRDCYDGLKKSYALDKDFFYSYDEYSLKRSRKDKDKDEDPSAGSDRGLKKRKLSKDAKPTTKPKKKDSTSGSSKGTKSQPKSTGKSVQSEEPVFEVADSDMPQDQAGNLGDNEDEPRDETASRRDWFKKPTPPQEPTDPDWNVGKTTKEGPAFRLLKGTRSNYAELEYDFEECYNAFSEKLDWKNPEGGDYPFDLSKTLPLITRGKRQRVPFEFSINNELKEQRKSFYAYALGMQSRGDVYSTKRILAVTRVSVIRKHGHGYLEEIVVRRADNVLYRFKEGDFSRLRINDIEDMLILVVQNRLTNISGDDVADFTIALRMFTRSLVIQKRVEESLSGVAKGPQGFIYVDDIGRNRLMHSDELYKFSDGTLTRLLSSLEDITKNIDIELLKERRMMRSLEKFVGEHAEFDESDTYVLERFDTSAGNPVKEILLKLNLPDHRIFKDGSEVVGEGKLIRLEIVQETTDKFSISDKVLLKVSPWKGLVRIGKRSKLAPRYVGPFKIVERISPVAYRLRLPQLLSGIHDAFHVINLKKCLADANLHVPLDEIKIDNSLRFIEESIEIMGREVKKLKQSRIPIVKDEIPLPMGIVYIKTDRYTSHHIIASILLSQFHAAMVPTVLSFLVFCFFCKGGLGTNITIVNECPFTVWPVILGDPSVNSTGFELTKGSSHLFQAPEHWAGRIWGRTGCNFNRPGHASCKTGDCLTGEMECLGRKGETPATLAEFTFLENIEIYDVSIVEGFNLQMVVQASGGYGFESLNCAKTGCVDDLNSKCKTELKLKGGGGCKSACQVFNSSKDCCTGFYASQQMCEITTYTKLFKSTCPRSYSYLYDDKKLFTCQGADYIVRFCPPADTFSTIKLGDQLKANDQLVSKLGVFELGFFGDEYNYLGIWYSTSSEPKRVWVANPNAPIISTSRAHALSINPETGNLIITVGGTTLMSITDVQAGPNPNVIATLEENGNFRLINQINNKVLWQSFDHPSDVLVPGMKLGYDLMTGQNWTLTSRLSHSIPGLGAFTLSWEPIDEASQRLLIRRRGQPYWTSGNLNSNKKLPTWILTPEGQLKDHSSSFWTPEFCYGYNLGNGCVESSVPQCRRESDNFTKMNGYFDPGKISTTLESNASQSISDCFVKCWNNCSCVGFDSNTYDGTGCVFWTGSGRFFVDNLGSSNSKHVVSYIQQVDTNNQQIFEDLDMWILIGVPIPLLFLCLGLSWYLKKRKAASKLDTVLEQPQQVTEPQGRLTQEN
ncbi:G-type lectin S-receptor-like serine/threonine-protein kinase [Tanacetum coccineum]